MRVFRRSEEASMIGIVAEGEGMGLGLRKKGVISKSEDGLHGAWRAINIGERDRENKSK